MWGYDRSEDNFLTPFKTQDEHFELFCMVLERGFAIHTGPSDRLLVEFRMTDTGAGRYLPRVKPKSGVSFRVPEACLKLSDLYLYYDPGNESDIPGLAWFRPESGEFLPFEPASTELPGSGVAEQPLPVVKLSTLKGLHYIKDIACLQMYELDFERLTVLDQALAQQLRETLERKMERFIEFSQPWAQASHAERVAQNYLQARSAGSKPGRREQQDKPAAHTSATQAGEHTDPDFLSWD